MPIRLGYDHHGVSFLIKNKVERERVVRYAYDFKKANFDELRQALSVTPLGMGFDEMMLINVGKVGVIYS